MTVRVEIDLNVRVRGNETFTGFDDIDLATVTRTRADRADGPVTVGDHVHAVEETGGVMADAVVIGERVIAFERESGLAGDATVTGVDAERRLIYLAVDWASMRDDPLTCTDP